MNRAIETLLGTTLILSTTLLYQVYFADPWFLVVLSIAALSATALGTALALLQRPLVTTAASLIGFVVLTIATLLAGTTASGFPTTRTFRILTHQVAEAWGNSLSVTLPADARPEVLMLPLAATWFSALGLTLLCHCSRVPLLPLIPALAAYLLALLVTAATHTSQLRVACLFIVAAALLGLTRARTSDRPADLPRTVPSGSARTHIRSQAPRSRSGPGVHRPWPARCCSVCRSSWRSASLLFFPGRTPLRSPPNRPAPRTHRPDRLSAGHAQALAHHFATPRPVQPEDQRPGR